MPDATAETDLELLARHRAGEGDAFAHIVGRYGGLVYGCCLRVTGDRHRAEDLAQETFFRLSRDAGGVSRSLPAWLHRVATRLSIDALRRKDARRRHERSAAREAGHNRMTQQTEERPGGADATWAEVGPLLDEALGELPDDARELLVRHFLTGQPQRDLAGDLGLSQATVSRRVKLALEQLRERLKSRGLVVGGAAALGTLLAQAPAHAAPASLAKATGAMSLVHSATAPPAPAAASAGLPALAGKAALAAVPAVGLAIAVALMVKGAALNPQAPPAPAPAPHTAQPTTPPTPPGQAGREEDAAHPAPAPAADLVLLPHAGRDDFDPGRMVAFERPTGRPGATVLALYADGHVATVTERDAARAVEAQTGRSMEAFLQDAVTVPADQRDALWLNR